mmetsp:Transcript_36291/g.95189  ORF Transcript_36291/g.95189 Transcript_36291/m.95189 type:complete len:633 (-) Transcript_36291:354-2252(-)
MSSLRTDHQCAKAQTKRFGHNLLGCHLRLCWPRPRCVTFRRRFARNLGHWWSWGSAWIRLRKWRSRRRCKLGRLHCNRSGRTLLHPRFLMLRRNGIDRGRAISCRVRLLQLQQRILPLFTARDHNRGGSGSGNALHRFPCEAFIRGVKQKLQTSRPIVTKCVLDLLMLIVIFVPRKIDIHKHGIIASNIRQLHQVEARRILEGWLRQIGCRRFGNGLVDWRQLLLWLRFGLRLLHLDWLLQHLRRRGTRGRRHRRRRRRRSRARLRHHRWSLGRRRLHRCGSRRPTHSRCCGVFESSRCGHCGAELVQGILGTSAWRLLPQRAGPLISPGNRRLARRTAGGCLDGRRHGRGCFGQRLGLGHREGVQPLQDLAHLPLELQELRRLLRRILELLLSRGLQSTVVVLKFANDGLARKLGGFLKLLKHFVLELLLLLLHVRQQFLMTCLDLVIEPHGNLLHARLQICLKVFLTLCRCGRWRRRGRLVLQFRHFQLHRLHPLNYSFHQRSEILKLRLHLGCRLGVGLWLWRCADNCRGIHRGNRRRLLIITHVHWDVRVSPFDMASQELGCTVSFATMRADSAPMRGTCAHHHHLSLPISSFLQLLLSLCKLSLVLLRSVLGFLGLFVDSLQGHQSM